MLCYVCHVVLFCYVVLCYDMIQYVVSGLVRLLRYVRVLVGVYQDTVLARTHTQTHTCTHESACICTHTHTHIYIYIYTHTYTEIYTHRGNTLITNMNSE